MDGVEFGMEGAEWLAGLVEYGDTGEVAEEFEDAGGGGSGAGAVLGVEPEVWDVSVGHVASDLSFNESADEQGDEVAGQQGLEPVRKL